MDQLELQVDPRSVTGKKVRFLRKQKIVPVHVFGPGMDSLSVQCDANQLRQVLPLAGKTGVVNLKLNGDTKTVMVREVQKNALTGELLHVDFFQVSMAEKITAEVPVILVGQAPALKIKENMLVQNLQSLTIEALPGQLPSSIELNVGSLLEAHQEIKIKNIRLNPKITVLNSPESTIVRISIMRAEKEEVVAAVAPVGEEAAAAAEGAPEAAAEGAEPAAKEGEKKEKAKE